MNHQAQPIDVQSQEDHRHLRIDEVGVRGVRYPLRLAGSGGVYPQDCQANFTMTVMLPADKKGTHMSRFIELLEEHRHLPFDGAVLRNLFIHMLRRLNAEQGSIDVRFMFFVEKIAPVSQVKSLMDYEGGWTIKKNIADDSPLLENIWITAPVTSLCPCSKAISEYGAHNQRSHLTLQATCQPNQEIGFMDLIRMAEEEASCQLYGILKRPDEKFITEYAYDHPKFVEDLVRDVAIRLRNDSRVKHYEVIAENFESIHNHSAYAVVRG